MKKLVLCDFDGTMTTQDLGYALLTHFSSGGWEEIDRQFREGRIGSREAYGRIAETLSGDPPSLRRFIEEHARIDRHFEAFYRACRKAGIDVKIVSDGLDFYIRAVLETYHLSEIQFYSNQGPFSEDQKTTIRFPFASEDCGRCGTCKRKLVQLHRKKYDSILFVGNGLSDRCAAQEADLVFAKDALYPYCVDQDIRCYFFEDFGEILRDLRKKINGIIFDLDGTLLEAYEAIYLGLKEAFRFFDKPFFPFESLRQHLKADLESTLAPFFSPEEIPKAIPVMRKRYEEVYLDKSHFLVGAKEVLETLGQEGIRLAVASNKFGLFSRRTLAHLGVGSYFRSVLGAGDGLRNKPCPDMIHASIKAMALPSDAVVFVGDSLEDIEAGKRAGIHVYALSTGAHSKQELSRGKPKNILKDLSELIPLVRNSGTFLTETPP